MEKTKRRKSHIDAANQWARELAHEDLGHLRRPIIGIYKPSSITKISPSI